MRTPAAMGTRRPSAAARSVVLLLVGSAVALAVCPVALPASYSWVAHTTSEAAGQGVAGAWVPRLGFLAFGFAVLLLIGVRGSSWGRVAARLHVAFGVLMIAAAAFSSRPWAATAPFDRVEDALHSVAATGMGFAFALGVGTAAWLGHRRFRVRDVVAMAAAVVLPLGMAVSQGQAGLLQRMMFAVAYWWYAAEALSEPPRPPQRAGHQRQLTRSSPG